MFFRYISRGAPDSFSVNFVFLEAKGWKVASIISVLFSNFFYYFRLHAPIWLSVSITGLTWCLPVVAIYNNLKKVFRVNSVKGKVYLHNLFLTNAQVTIEGQLLIVTHLRTQPQNVPQQRQPILNTQTFVVGKRKWDADQQVEGGAQHWWFSRAKKYGC